MNTRDPDVQEIALWTKYRVQFQAITRPKVQALVFLAKVANAAQNEIQAITGTPQSIIDEASAKRINLLGHYSQILENQITGVALKKYGIKIDDNGEIGIFADAAPEGDIFPSFSGLGFPFLIVAGIAAVTLLASGFITLKIIEARAKDETTRLMAKMTEADREMMNKPKEEREQWERWKKNAAKQAADAAKNIPGVNGLLERFIGTKGTSIAIGGLLGIAALYFLIPKLRRN
jgi:hypothetical protein